MEAEYNSDEQFIINDPDYVIQTLRKMIKDGIEAFQVIADFDQTLTRCSYNDK